MAAEEHGVPTVSWLELGDSQQGQEREEVEKSLLEMVRGHFGGISKAILFCEGAK
jgi:hypothetical protein